MKRLSVKSTCSASDACVIDMLLVREYTSKLTVREAYYYY